MNWQGKRFFRILTLFVPNESVLGLAKKFERTISRAIWLSVAALNI